MVKLLGLIAAIWVMMTLRAFNADTPEAWQSWAGLIRPTAFVLAVLGAWAAARGLQRLWRASRRVKAETVARTAGALTAAAQDRVTSIRAAFKDGTGR